MNKFLDYLYYFLIMFITEFIIAIFIGLLLFLFESYFPQRLVMSLNQSFSLMYGRVKYHYFLYIPLFIFLMRFWDEKNYYHFPNYIGLCNVFLYFLILVFYGIFIDSYMWKMLRQHYLYFYAIGLYLNPFIIYKIPYVGEKIIRNLEETLKM